MIANNVTGLNAGGGVINRGVPGVTISLGGRQRHQGRCSPAAVTLTWTANRVNAVNPNGGTDSIRARSYGMTAELKIKPNIGAPGGLIRSTYPLERGDRTGYAILSGTSMASPHVAGATALLLQAKPGTTPARAKQLFQNSADPGALPPPNNGSAFLEAVHRQGAGMIDIDDSILRDRLGVAERGLARRGHRRHVHADDHEQRRVGGHVHARPRERCDAAARNTNAPSLRCPPSRRPSRSAHRRCVVPARRHGARVDVTVTASRWLSSRQYGGFSGLNGSDGTILRVPYAGFSGDYQAIQVLHADAVRVPVAREA